MSNGEDKGLYARHVLINYASLLVSCRDLLKLRIDGSVSGMSRQVEGSLQDVDNLKKDGLGRESVRDYFEFEIGEEDIGRLRNILVNLRDDAFDKEDVDSELKYISEKVRSLPPPREIPIKFSWFESLFRS